jgi:DNA-directed RNA polymerase subunit RPC12/RpoP
MARKLCMPRKSVPHRRGFQIRGVYELLIQTNIFVVNLQNESKFNVKTATGGPFKEMKCPKCGGRLMLDFTGLKREPVVWWCVNCGKEVKIKNVNNIMCYNMSKQNGGA